jgi:uncharacterized repeat protein (TIGR03803 family)
MRPQEIGDHVMKNHSYSSRAFLIMIAAFAILSVVSASAKETPIFRFNVENGSQPINGLLADGHGNFYGVTPNGGNKNCSFHGCGVVFELSPASGGAWTETVIWAFKGGSSDTAIPITELIFDANGNLFGGTGTFGNSLGAIYELSPASGGTWTEKIVYHFNNQGYDPGAKLAFDSQGNLYGSVVETNRVGGNVFRLSPQSNGTWSETLIHKFTSSNGDGYLPRGGVILDSKGNIYGTTSQGGLQNDGIVYELSPNGSGGYSETIVFTFTGQSTGSSPYSAPTLDANGNLFGTTFGGGTNFVGIVYELTKSGNKWNETVLHNFGAPDGSAPNGVVVDAKGNLYGTTEGGGSGCNNPGCGIVYELTPQTTPPWKETILYNFESSTDGSISTADVTIDATTGYIYGTTQYGGTRNGNGTVFQIQP